MSKGLRDADYLMHILDAIGRIHRYTSSIDESGFLSDELTQDGVIRNLEVVGEAVTKLSPELKIRYADVPWGEIAGMRNRLIHAYMSVNLEIVWDTVQKIIPTFSAKVLSIQRDLERPAAS